jgi:hypothetical protein
MKKAKKRENSWKGLHIHRITPIIFGGDPVDSKNITIITRLEHAELATFWNRTIKEQQQ